MGDLLELTTACFPCLEHRQNAGPLLKVYVFGGSFVSAVD